MFTVEIHIQIPVADALSTSWGTGTRHDWRVVLKERFYIDNQQRNDTLSKAHHTNLKTSTCATNCWQHDEQNNHRAFMPYVCGCGVLMPYNCTHPSARREWLWSRTVAKASAPGSWIWLRSSLEEHETTPPMRMVWTQVSVHSWSKYTTRSQELLKLQERHGTNPLMSVIWQNANECLFVIKVHHANMQTLEALGRAWDNLTGKKCYTQGWEVSKSAFGFWAFTFAMYAGLQS